MIAPLLLVDDLDPESKTTINASTTTTASFVRDVIDWASQYVSGYTNRRFDERIATRYYTARLLRYGGAVDGRSLLLDDDLRSVTTISNDGESVSSASYLLRPANADARGVVAYREIKLKSNSGVSWGATSDPEDSIVITGTWGYGGEWVALNITLDGGIDDSTTTVTVSDGTNVKVGMTLKVDSEYMLVSAVATNDLTVERGFNGSTAATHNTGAAVYRWRPLRVVSRLVERLTLWKIEQNRAPLSGQQVIGDLVYPVDTSGVPADIVKDVGLLRYPVMPVGV